MMEGAFRFLSGMMIGVLGMGVSGCLLGPDYQQPSIEAPSTWDEIVPAQKETAGEVSTAELPEAEWWRAFQNDELNSLIQLALRRNHNLREAAFRVLEGRALVLDAGSGLYPQVNVNGTYTRTRRSETILVGPTSGAPAGFAPPGANFDIWNALVDLRWELDVWGRIRRGMEAASAEEEALEQDRRAIMLTLVSEVGQTYFELRSYDEEIDIAQRTLKNRQEFLALVRRRAEAGLVSDLDLNRAELLVAQSEAVLPDLFRLRASTQHRLDVLVGAPLGSVGNDLPPRPLREVVVQPIIPIGLPSALLERRPDIMQVEQQLIAANARIGEARAYFFPSLSITGSGGFQTSEFAKWLNGGSRTFSIGPSVTLPIFLGGTNQARLELAEARHEQMLEQYQQTILEAFQEVADLLVALEMRSRQLASLGKQLTASRKIRDLLMARFHKGINSLLDVLIAEQDVLAVEREVVQIRQVWLSGMVALFKAVGGGWEAETSAGEG